MRRTLALGALAALVVAGLLPATGHAETRSIFALAGEARALEIALGDKGVTLGLALARGDSTPFAQGVGAGQCAVLGDSADPSNLPCTETNTELSATPDALGDDMPSCTAALPAPLNTLLTLDTACGLSKSGITADGLPFSTNEGTVATLAAKIPVTTILPVAGATQQVDEVVDTITDTLSPVLDQLPSEVENAVENVVETVQSVTQAKVLEIRVGESSSKIVPDGDTIKVESLAAGARIGLLGIPGVTEAGNVLAGTADPLENGLIIIEVASARASATVDQGTATATSAADPALVRVKVRDITKLEPSYVEVAVAPGQTITLLQGTPLESTISVADSSTENTADGAIAAADAVRLHLLKGIQGGLKVGLGRATAAASVAPRQAGPAPAPEAPPAAPPAKPAPPVKRPPISLPVTGGTDMSAIALMLMIAAAGALAARRRFVTN